MKIILPFFCFLLSFVNTFNLEGSESSFVRYPKWYHSFENTLSFEFKTWAIDGLLFYTDDGGRKGNFYEISLNRGILQVKFKIGRETKQTALMRIENQMVNDGVWHKVHFYQFWEKIKLQMDEWVQFKSLQQKNTVFGQYDTNLEVFIGGLPRDLPDNTLSSPLSKRMLHFAGSVRNVVYRTFSHGVTAPHILDKNGLRHTEDDFCSQRTTTLCKNAGICYSSNNGPKCNCAHTDFYGSRCDIEKKTHQASFYGTEFLSYNFEEHGNGIVSREENVTLHFKTRRPGGLLFYAGDQDDYIHICLERGVVVATVNLGGSSRQIRVSPFKSISMGTASPGLRFNDNTWHKLVFHRQLKLITLTVDSVFSDITQSAGSREWLTNVFAYVGGVPKMKIDRNIETNKFVGCLSKIRYRADSHYIDFLQLAKQGSGQSIIQISGNVLFSCRDLAAPEPVSFTTSETYVKLPFWEAPKSGSISFSLRTNEADGLIMFNSGPVLNTTADFFAFELLDGLLFFVINLGSGPIQLQTGSSRIDDEKWHNVTFVRSSRSGSVQVDGQKTDFNTPGAASQLDLGGTLYLGGFTWDEPGFTAVVPSDVYTMSLRKGFIGCIRYLRLNGLSIEIIDLLTQRNSAQVEVGCISGLDQCPSAPCQHGAICTEGWNRFICNCDSTSKSGLTCEEDPMKMKFEREDQLLRVTLPYSFRSKAEDVQVKFRTGQSTGVLVATSCQHTFDRMEILLHKGALELHLNFGSGEHSFKWGKNLDDDRWHTAKIKRRGQDIELFLDGVRKKKEKVTALLFELEYDSFWAGKSKNPSSNFVMTSESRSAETSVSLGGFLGEMSGFVFNKIGIFRLANKQKNGDLINGSKLNVTAKFGAHRSVRENVITLKTRSAYAILPDALLSAMPLLHIFFQFRTLESDGLILYSRGLSRDFIAVELEKSRLKYTFNSGDGPESLYSNLHPLNDFNWHMVLITQPSPGKHMLAVDDTETKLNVQGTNKQLNLRGPLYIGGVGQTQFRSISDAVRSRHGFRGCLASLEISQQRVDVLRQNAENGEMLDVEGGCKGPTIVCQDGSCSNGGVCLQKWSNITCDCSMTTFAGPKCTEASTSFRFGPRPGMIVFEYPTGHEPSTEKDSLALGFKTVQENAVLFRVDCSVKGDYFIVHIVDGYVRATYNLGTQDHVIGAVDRPVNDNRYHVIRFYRTEANATFQLDEQKRYSRTPFGSQLKTLNRQSVIQVGGRTGNSGNDYRNRRSSDIIRDPFVGAISGINYNGLRLLDLAALGDPRIKIVGDPPPNRLPGSVLEPINAEQWPSDESNGKDNRVDDLISSRMEGSGCQGDGVDDEDCTIVPDTNPTSDLITPVFIPDPTTTTTQIPTTAVTDEIEGSGAIEEEEEESDPDPRMPPTPSTIRPGVGDPEWTSLTNKELEIKIPTSDTTTIETTELTTESTTTTTTSTSTSPPTIPTTRSTIIRSTAPPQTIPHGADATDYLPGRPTSPMGPVSPTTTEPLVNPKSGEAGFSRTSLLLGVSLGLIIIISLVVFIVFKCYNRTKQADSYTVEVGNTKAYAPLTSGHVAPGMDDSVVATRVNGYTKGVKRKGFKEWYV